MQYNQICNTNGIYAIGDKIQTISQWFLPIIETRLKQKDTNKGGLFILSSEQTGDQLEDCLERNGLDPKTNLIRLNGKKKTHQWNPLETITPKELTDATKELQATLDTKDPNYDTTLAPLMAFALTSLTYRLDERPKQEEPNAEKKLQTKTLISIEDITRLICDKEFRSIELSRSKTKGSQIKRPQTTERATIEAHKEKIKSIIKADRFWTQIWSNIENNELAKTIAIWADLTHYNQANNEWPTNAGTNETTSDAPFANMQEIIKNEKFVIIENKEVTFITSLYAKLAKLYWQKIITTEQIAGQTCMIENYSNYASKQDALFIAQGINLNCSHLLSDTKIQNTTDQKTWSICNYKAWFKTTNEATAQCLERLSGHTWRERDAYTLRNEELVILDDINTTFSKESTKVTK